MPGGALRTVVIYASPVSAPVPSLTALLALLVAVPPAAGPQAAPPAEAVLVDDSLVVVGGAEAWPFRFLEVAGDDEPWIEIEDPYGGRVRVPALYFRTIGNEYEAHAGGGRRRVTWSIPVANYVLVLTVALLGLATAIVGPIVWYRHRYRRERERRVAFQTTARQLAESREDERLRIARDLHDGPLQDLQALHMQLSLAHDTLREDGDAGVGARRLLGAQDEAHTIIGELRGIAEALRPPALGPFGLAAALRTHAERFQRRHPGIRVTLDLDDDGQSLPEPVRIALFRITQEALNNAAHHGNPGAIEVRFRTHDGRTELVIDDDGSGLGSPDLRALADEGHFGLLGMRERAGSIGAHLQVEDRDGGGVRVRVTVLSP